MSTTEQIAVELTRLSSEQQRQVLDYARALQGGGKQRRGARLEDLLPLVGSISKEDLDEMEKAIEEGCEQVNEDAWK